MNAFRSSCGRLLKTLKNVGRKWRDNGNINCRRTMAPQCSIKSTLDTDSKKLNEAVEFPKWLTVHRCTEIELQDHSCMMVKTGSRDILRGGVKQFTIPWFCLQWILIWGTFRSRLVDQWQIFSKILSVCIPDSRPFNKIIVIYSFY